MNGCAKDICDDNILIFVERPIHWLAHNRSVCSYFYEKEKKKLGIEFTPIGFIHKNKTHWLYLTNLISMQISFFLSFDWKVRVFVLHMNFLSNRWLFFVCRIKLHFWRYTFFSRISCINYHTNIVNEMQFNTPEYSALGNWRHPVEHIRIRRSYGTSLKYECGKSLG